MNFPELFIAFLLSPNPAHIWHVKSLKDFYKTTKNADADNQALFGPSAKVKNPEYLLKDCFFLMLA